LKNIITADDWNNIKNDVEFEFTNDLHFIEAKESELISNRLNQLRDIENYVGKYFSLQWVRSNILYMSDEDQKEMEKQIAQEIKDGAIPNPAEQDGQDKGW
jgi:hypothetical protein